MANINVRMRTCLILFVLIVNISWIQSEEASSIQAGLMVTTPMSWVSDTDESICLVSRPNSPSLQIDIQITNKKDDETLDSQEVDLDPGESKCVEIHVSEDWDTDNVVLSVVATDDNDDEVFNKNATVSIYKNNVMIFVQTDKPVYKPADTVRIRVLSVIGADTLPIDDPISEIIIEDPAKTRIMQWKDVNTTLGLGSMEMKLSSEPPYGMWTIQVTIREKQETLKFEVKEYVLPKYSVDITHDSAVYVYADEVKWKVCATYTYGEPVNGKVNTHICDRLYQWTQDKKKCVSHNDTQLKNGCYEFSANISDLKKTDSMYYGGRSIDLYAEVAEKGTGIVFNKTSETHFSDQKYNLDFGSSPANYKPGLDCIGKAVLKDTIGNPAANITLYLTYKGYKTSSYETLGEGEVITDNNGMFTYNVSGEFTHTANKSSITVEVSLTRTTPTSEPSSRVYRPHRPSELGYPNTHTIKAWYSPSNTYLAIAPLPEQQMTCKIPEVIKFSVASSAPLAENTEFQVQIVSHGNIIPTTGLTATREASWTSSGLNHYSYSIRLDSATKDSVQGNTNILVFFIRPDGETISDGIITNFVHCFKNKVSATFSDTKARPGHESSFSISADAKSLCSIAVVDKSIKLMGASYLTSAKIQDRIKTRYDMNKNQNIYSNFASTSTCVKQEDDDIFLTISNFNSKQYDMNSGPRPRPRFIGMLRAKRSVMYPHGASSDFVDAQKPFEDLGLLTLTDLTLITKPCRKWQYRYYVDSDDRMDMIGGDVNRADVAYRRTSLTAISMESNVVAAPQSDPAPALHRNFFPETWLWDLHTVGDSKELKVPVTLPHTITEWIGNGYCINPQSGLGVSPSFSVTGFQSFFMSFTLPYSMIRGEEAAVPVSVFNYLTECLTVSLKIEDSPGVTVVNNSNIAKLKVCGGMAEVHTFFIVPRELGKVNFTVRASSMRVKKAGSNSIYTQEETDVEDLVTRQLLVEAEGKPEEISKSAFVCNQGGGDWTFTLPPDVVQDSERSDISVIGDVMGPALSGLDSLLRVPTGCGEQNMLLFAPNIYVLQYLNKTRRLTSDIKTKALENMRTGYQRELNYRHDDGSYSAFGKSDSSGSIWLTAFVVKCFAQAKPHMFIDDKDLNVSIEWLKNAQLENGCFPQIGKVLHKDMQGGAKGEATTPLTAFILVTLLEAGVDKNAPVIENAFSCLKFTLNSGNIEDVYTLALMGYAYSMLDDTADYQKSKVNDKLETKAVTGSDMKHWESSPEATHDDYHHSSPANIEATSYVLLSLLHGADQSVIGRALPIIRWLSSQRNSLGGFSSTQDTVLALQGLAQYAGLVYSDNTDLNIQVVANNVNFDFDVTSENSLLLQKHEGLATHNIVHYNVEGTGCALLQATLKFNRMSLQEDIPPSFELPVVVKDVKETKQKCSERTLNICVRYNGTETKSNMAIIGVKMVSGWIPVKDSVHKLKNQARLNLKRFEIEKNSVQLYFDEIDGRKRCFDIDVEQDQYVSDSKPAIVQAYDYYKPAYAAYTQYEIESTCLQRKSRSASLDAAPEAPKPGKGNKKPKPGSTTKKPKKNSNCPVCDETIDNAALEDFCDSPYVFKVTAGRRTTMTLKEIIRSKSKASKMPQINSSLKYKLPNKCQCDLVTDGAELLVASPKRPHQKKAGDDWIFPIKKGARILKADGTVDCPVS